MSFHTDAYHTRAYVHVAYLNELVKCTRAVASRMRMTSAVDAYTFKQRKTKRDAYESFRACALRHFYSTLQVKNKYATSVSNHVQKREYDMFPLHLCSGLIY